MHNSGDTLRRLVIHDDAYLEWIMAQGFSDTSASGLDSKTQSLARVGALIAVDASTPEYLSAVGIAHASGASTDEIVGVLVAVLPSIGADRVLSAAPKLALALGYDVDEALERFNGPTEPRR